MSKIQVFSSCPLVLSMKYVSSFPLCILNFSTRLLLYPIRPKFPHFVTKMEFIWTFWVSLSSIIKTKLFTFWDFFILVNNLNVLLFNRVIFRGPKYWFIGIFVNSSHIRPVFSSVFWKCKVTDFCHNRLLSIFSVLMRRFESFTGLTFVREGLRYALVVGCKTPNFSGLALGNSENV